MAVLIWLHDSRTPFYMAPRVGKEGRPFRMIKLRSMTVGSDRSGVTDTKADDPRITPIGHIVRRYKLDELPQLWNVLRGEMSLVGPRPQVQHDVDRYSDEERRLLTVRPGMTDFASIVFADESELLRGSPDPASTTARFIRPWKSRLGLFYIDHRTTLLDLQLMVLTGLALFARAPALLLVSRILQTLGAEKALVEIARRRTESIPLPPSGVTAT